jgi:hypothetical protein
MRCEGGASPVRAGRFSIKEEAGKGRVKKIYHECKCGNGMSPGTGKNVIKIIRAARREPRLPTYFISIIE